MDSYNFVYKIQATFNCNPYTKEMAKLIIQKFKSYDPATLSAIYNLIVEKWEPNYGLPNLASIKRMIREHNETSFKDNHIGPNRSQRALPENTEEYMDKEEMARQLRECLKFLTTNNRKVRRSNGY